MPAKPWTWNAPAVIVVVHESMSDVELRKSEKVKSEVSPKTI